MKINVTEYLDETILQYGNKIAIEDINGTITFDQLQQCSGHDIGIRTVK